MKNKILLFTGLLLLFSFNISSKESEGNVKDNSSPKAQIKILSSPDLYNLTNQWAKEYGRLHPDVNISVINSPEVNQSNFKNNETSLGFISNQYYSKIDPESIWKMVVGRDIVVPVISSTNPLLNEIYQQGISAKELTSIIENTVKQNWGTLLKNGQNAPIKYYIINEPGVISSMANFLGVNQDQINGIILENKSELLSKIQNDHYAIGFCKINNILDVNEQEIVSNVRLLPIDRNANGKLDYMEKIYDNLTVFQRGVWVGKYPRALCSNIYSISGAKPTSEAETGFLKWVMSDGQKFLTQYGFNDLVISERQSQIENLAPVVSYTNTAKETYNQPNVGIIILVLVLVFLFVFDMISRYLGSVKGKKSEAGIVNPQVFNESSVKSPNGMFYDKTHTWAFMDTDGKVKIGIDDFFQHVTGPLTSIRMKKPGEKIKKGEQVFSIIQKGKQLNIYAPITGTIIAQNDLLNSDSSLINSSPYNDGWVYLIEPSNWLRDLQFLVMADTYRQWIKKEFIRLKDFLAADLKVHKVEYAQVVLQDGGELKDCVLEDLGPEVWEDFQSKFIDSFK